MKTDKDELEITQMRPEDAAEVAAIERMTFSLPWSEQGFLSSLQSQDTVYLTVRQKGKLIAYCGFLQSFEEADITNVAVHPDFRGKGIGYTMLCELMERGRKRGVERYTLEVRAGNAHAIRLYRKLGFESIGIRKNFYEKPKEDAVIMWTQSEDANG